MTLPTPTPTGSISIANGNFEEGATGWTTTGTASIVNESPIGGSWSVKVQAAGEANDGGVYHNTLYPVVPGQSITVSVVGIMPTGTPGTSFAVGFQWFNLSGNVISSSNSSQINRQLIGSSSGTASVTSTAPAGAAYVKVFGSLNASASSTVSTIYLDNFSWNYSSPVTITLTSPTLIEYDETDVIPLNISTTLSSGISISQVQYFYQTYSSAAGGFIDETLITTLPGGGAYAFNAPAMSPGTYAFYAKVTLSNGLVIVTNNRQIDVDQVIVLTREYKASNAYTMLVGSNFANLASNMPSTARVTGVEVLVNYSMDILSRSRDYNISDPTNFNPNVAFSILSGGSVEATLLSRSGNNYSILGSPQSADISITRDAFSLGEQGTADTNYKWTTFSSGNASVTIGDDENLFSIDPVDATTFLTYSVGLRFVPKLGSRPEYSQDGDLCVRFKVNSYKIRVYFNAGSVDYYFASPDKTQVIRGELAAVSLDSGSLATGDAAGVMQLTTDLTIMDGTQSYIGNDWTIHSNYPVSNDNQIGEVTFRDDAASAGMDYNSIPGQLEIVDNRSRYVFITANFYGDPNLDSIYGANGVDRAFAYNGDYFYKIVTTSEDALDKPRHVAFHHSHLALGYGEGRVDISVVGEPYNFNGLDGASSWAVGDNVTGLLPLSGSTLGVFCAKSIVGIAGTTVDNFTTQTISPSLGAIEYTITNMGFPVYANRYGVYTLAQTQQYGDFSGAALSQQISPWIRPRLLRKNTSEKEVVVAWPVRTKNQYKLAFADGYVLSMTMNYAQQGSPTFAKQKYFITNPDDPDSYEGYDLLEYPSIYPIAVSSEMDDSGEERIHIAHKWGEFVEPPQPLPELQLVGTLSDWTTSSSYTGTLQINNAVGSTSVIQIAGDSLPSGSTLTVVDDNVILSWPADVDYDKEQISLTLRITDSTERTALWTGNITVILAPTPTSYFSEGVIDNFSSSTTARTFVDDPSRNRVLCTLYNTTTLLASSDGIVWNKIGDLPASFDTTDSKIIVHSSGRIYGYSNSLVFWSDDGGISWSTNTSLIFTITDMLEVGDGRVLIATNDSIGYTSNGTTITTYVTYWGTAGKFGYSPTLNCILHVTDTRIRRSTNNGLAWTVVYDISDTSYMQTPIWCPELSMFLIGGNRGAMYYSTDGISWQNTPVAQLGTNSFYTSMTYNSGAGYIMRRSTDTDTNMSFLHAPSPSSLWQETEGLLLGGVINELYYSHVLRRVVGSVVAYLGAPSTLRYSNSTW